MKQTKFTTWTVLILTTMTLLTVSLRAQQPTRQDTLVELMRRIDILTEEIEKTKLGEVAGPNYERRYGMGPAASRVYHLAKTGVSLAGYGEVVYENFSSEKDDGSDSGKADKIDFLRHVTYFGYRFNDRFLFNSEIELEHAKTGEGSSGEVSVEFAYIEAMLSKAVNFRAGMVLTPVGIINELHEPPIFPGTLRPEVERRIVPSTWRANGLGLVGEAATGLNYKIYVTESLRAAAFSSDGVRSGRQNGAKAVAENLAVSGRLGYSGIPGLDIAGSFFLGNTGQDLVDSAGNDIDAFYTLWSVHAIFARRGLELRGLFAQSTIDDVTKLNDALGLTGSSSIGEKQSGYYLTAAYDVMPLLVRGTTHYLAPYIQYEQLDTQDNVPSAFSKNPARKRQNFYLGLTYKPIPNIAFKIDYVNRDDDADSAVDQFNLAMNYLF